jgi:hypothetical protein
MALEFGELDRVFDPALILPIPIGEGANKRVKRYRIEDCPALLGLYCQRVWAVGVEVAAAALSGGDDQPAQDALDGLSQLPPPPGVDPGVPLHVAVLGAAYQQMLDDGVSSQWIEHAGRTTIAWQAGGDDLARQYWASAGRPELMAPNRQQRRSQGSTSGTTSRHRPNRRRGGRSGGTNS